MTPRVIVVSGSSKGLVIAMTDDGISIGRDSSNSLSLPDPTVSRRHCRIHKPGDDYELIDLDSHNGTFVNGLPVSQKTLSDGDTIQVGNSELLFTSHDEDPGSTNLDLYSQDSPSEMNTVRVDEALYANVGPEMGRIARDLAALVRISTVVNSIRDLGQLQRDILRLILEVIPARKSAIVLIDPVGEQPTSVCSWNRRAGDKSSVAVESAIVSRTFWEGSITVTKGSHESGDNRHVLCGPLVGVQRTVGVIYLTSCDATSPFLDDHIQFLSSVSRIAAVALENLLTLDKLGSENQRLREQVFSSTLVGESKEIRKLEDFVARVAAGDVTVLIRGESGTGKELVARSIHQNSARSDRPFVAINCAAIPEGLLESELFGHEKGAYTGAVATKKGKLEAAEDGTLFLDEIGELAPVLQAKLLRVLQQREFERIGGNRSMQFAARVVAATNKDLEKAIKSGEFRQDLYYSLNVVSVTVPPLRERRNDIPLLALYFAAKYSAKSKRAFKGISKDTRTLLLNYSWPGNVRELENAIEHAIVLGVSDEILPDDLPAAILEEQGAQMEGSRYHTALNNTKRELVLEALRNASGSFPEAARFLGIHPKYLFRLVRNLKLRTEFR